MAGTLAGNNVILSARSQLPARAADAGDLVAAGFSIIEAWSTDDALSYLESRSDIDLVICEADMPGGLNGFELAAFIGQRWPDIQIIIL